MSIIIPANSAVSGGFEVANSLMFASGDSAYLNRAGAGGASIKKMTYSFWVKRGILGATENIMSFYNSSTDYLRVYFNDSDRLNLKQQDGGTTHFQIIPLRQYRDVSAWYHIVIAIDTTQSDESLRVKIYTNGFLETAFDTSTYPSLNRSLKPEAPKFIGSHSTGNYFDGYMAEFAFIVDSQNAQTDFGEFNEDNGIWQPIDVSGLTFGTNGFYLDFEDSSALGNDANGSNNFTVNNIAATDQATDTCTNNFCTLNSLWVSRFDNDGTMSQGNCRGSFTADNAARGSLMTTMGVSAGKWYWEAKVIDKTRLEIGIAKESLMGVNEVFYDATTYNAVAINNSGEVYGRYTGSAIDEFATSVSIANNDILGFALDRDNKELYISKNGTYVNSGDPTSGSSRTGGLIDELTGSRDSYIPDNEFIFPFMQDPSTSGQLDIEYNFGGCPAFAISSGNTDGNGYGNFEYSVPSGYFSLNTKNLAEYG